MAGVSQNSRGNETAKICATVANETLPLDLHALCDHRLNGGIWRGSRLHYWRTVNGRPDYSLMNWIGQYGSLHANVARSLPLTWVLRSSHMIYRDFGASDCKTEVSRRHITNLGVDEIQ
jgi:hypothetical protein